MTYWLGILISALEVLPALIVVGWLQWQLHRMEQDPRREGLTIQLLNLPGAGLLQQAEALSQTQIDRLIWVAIIGLSASMILAFQRIAATPFVWNLLDVAVVIFNIGLGLFFGRMISRDMPKIRRLRRALRAEQATAQEIHEALAGNNRVIHDVQAGEFNIDHVVITPGGVFAVETKARLKPPVGSGSPEVIYDGNCLNFGTWQETKPLEQAARQAKWLAKYLKESTGATYEVTPILAIPSWAVKITVRREPGMVLVLNPKNIGSIIFSTFSANRLTPEAIQQAAFQIQQLAKGKTD